MPTLPEWIIILVILAIVFSASRLGDVGDAIGRAVQWRRRK